MSQSVPPAQKSRNKPRVLSLRRAALLATTIFALGATVFVGRVKRDIGLSSIGAIVTLRLALRQPERFRALILVEPVRFPL